MTDFRVGYLYSLAPIHCGGEGDLGNILEIAREVHTKFPYAPGSSLRGSLRNEVTALNPTVADQLFGQELKEGQQMGVHQVWFGDARLLWVPMATMSKNNNDVFTWVSCHSLLRDHAILSGRQFVTLPNHPVGTSDGTYEVADARIKVDELTEEQKEGISFAGDFPKSLKDSVQPAWRNSHVILPDADFQVLLEHSLWTQIRNKIQEAGSAEVFWTDVCIPRDTILYFPWNYNLSRQNLVTLENHQILIDVLQGLIQVGGQANVGRGWVQSWVNNVAFPGQVTSQAVGV